jgi:hypothetical protein
LVQAFDLFDDPMVKQLLDGKPHGKDANQQLELIKKIEADATATPWSRSNALWKLIKGQSKANVLAALCAQKTAA